MPGIILGPRPDGINAGLAAHAWKEDPLRVPAYLCALVLACVFALAGCSSGGPLGPEEPGGGPLAPAGDPCDPIMIPC